MVNAALSCLTFILLFIFISSADAAPQCGIEKFNQYQMQYCWYKGKGPLLVLEGSQGNDMTVWPKSFLHKLNQFAEVLVYNRVGYGQSSLYKSKYNNIHVVTAKSVAEHLHALTSRLKINKPIIVVAHSIGGIYAQYFIRNYPVNIAGLVMIDADSSFEPKVNSPFQSKTPDKKGSMGSLEAIGFNQSMDQVNASPRLPNIPLLVITATNHGSSAAIEELWQQLQKKIVKQSPQGKQIIAQGSGHFVYLDAQALVLNAIEQWIHDNHIK